MFDLINKFSSYPSYPARKASLMRFIAAPAPALQAEFWRGNDVQTTK